MDSSVKPLHTTFLFTFGQYAGIKLEDLPEEYLEWIGNRSYIKKYRMIAADEIIRRYPGKIIQEFSDKTVSLLSRNSSNLILREEALVEYNLRKIAKKIKNFFIPKD